MPAKLPQAAGVYQILCRATGKLYVGSSVDLFARWAQHRVALRRGIHQNYRLQKAWEEYGEEAFEFSILELVDKDDLLLVEQAWLDKTKSANPENGFNIFDKAGSPGTMFADVWEGFVDPLGNELVIFNLHEFCRQQNLDFPSMHRLATGQSKLKSHKGWSHKNSIRKRDYIKTWEGFIDPTGKLVGPITNLAEFCRERGLDNTHMIAVMKGRICSHKGWTHINARKPQDVKTYTGFINPQGERVLITNLREFCREQGLHVVHTHQLKNGQRRSHKGWTYFEEERDEPCAEQ
jgi:hypothetical protein